MTKQVMQYRVCDCCPTEPPAVVTEKLQLNGARVELDLCQKCSDRLYSDFLGWADKGTPIGNGTVFDQQRQITGPVLVNLDVPKKVSDRPTVISEEMTEEPTPIARNQPASPPTAHRWIFTDHALERVQERNLNVDEVLFAAERPAFVYPSKTDPGLEVRTLNNVTAIVDPILFEIITAYDSASEGDREPLKAAGAR